MVSFFKKTCVASCLVFKPKKSVSCLVYKPKKIKEATFPKVVVLVAQTRGGGGGVDWLTSMNVSTGLI